MAVIRTAMRVDFRRGLYATRSMTTPSTVHAAMAIRSDSTKPSFRWTMQK